MNIKKCNFALVCVNCFERKMKKKPNNLYDTQDSKKNERKKLKWCAFLIFYIHFISIAHKHIIKLCLHNKLFISVQYFYSIYLCGIVVAVIFSSFSFIISKYIQNTCLFINFFNFDFTLVSFAAIRGKTCTNFNGH